MMKNGPIRLFSILIILVVIPIQVLGKDNRNSETAKISGKAVIFFGPSREEYELVLPEEKNGLAAALDDLLHYFSKLRPYLKEHGIDSGMTSSLTIQIRLNDGQKKLYKRKELGSAVGYIMTDGIQTPKVISDPGTDVDELPTIKAFFKIE